VRRPESCCRPLRGRKWLVVELLSSKGRFLGLMMSEVVTVSESESECARVSDRAQT
jgi:hypothetical protein